MAPPGQEVPAPLVNVFYWEQDTVDFSAVILRYVLFIKLLTLIVMLYFVAALPPCRLL